MKGVSIKILGSAVHATSRSDAATGGRFGVPPNFEKKRLYLVASGSIENEFNVILMMKHEIQEDFVINLILYENWKQKL